MESKGKPGEALVAFPSYPRSLQISFMYLCFSVAPSRNRSRGPLYIRF
jgi:hypothetical protein